MFLGVCAVSRTLGAIDAGYAGLFPNEDVKIDELAVRLQRYLCAPSTAPVAQLPLGEVMLSCCDDTNTQHFIPFVNVSIFFALL